MILLGTGIVPSMHPDDAVDLTAVTPSGADWLPVSSDYLAPSDLGIDGHLPLAGWSEPVLAR